jgi:hypothetical protein
MIAFVCVFIDPTRSKQRVPGSVLRLILQLTLLLAALFYAGDLIFGG